jgi:hypothetical protein
VYCSAWACSALIVAAASGDEEAMKRRSMNLEKKPFEDEDEGLSWRLVISCWSQPPLGEVALTNKK